jgi:uncharacterized membrane protein
VKTIWPKGWVGFLIALIVFAVLLMIVPTLRHH